MRIAKIYVWKYFTKLKQCAMPYYCSPTVYAQVSQNILVNPRIVLHSRNSAMKVRKAFLIFASASERFIKLKPHSWIAAVVAVHVVTDRNRCNIRDLILLQHFFGVNMFSGVHLGWLWTLS